MIRTRNPLPVAGFIFIINNNKNKYHTSDISECKTLINRVIITYFHTILVHTHSYNNKNNDDNNNNK